MRKLTKDQTAAVEKLSRLKVGALLMSCGTGKTQTAAALVNSVDNVDCLFWLCPCKVKENLKTELEKCGCKYPAHIVGIESIGCSDRIFMEELAYIQQYKRVFFVLDESIKVKNPRAKRSSRILQLAQHSEYRIILNGTPVTKNIMDIYNQMQVLSPRVLGCRNEWAFRDRYCRYTTFKRGGRIEKQVITGYANVDHLLSLIEPYVFKCNLELKVEKRYHTLHWWLDFDEQEAYDELKAELFRDYKEDDGDSILGILQKLQHSYACARNKWKLLDEYMTDKTIVFCKFHRSRDAVQERYPQAKVLTYGTGSFGLNLQDYNRIIYFDKTFDYSFREQSEGRIYRNGQKLDCEYYDLTGDMGLEEMIDRCICQKEGLVQHFKKQGKNLKKMIEKL